MTPTSPAFDTTRIRHSLGARATRAPWGAPAARRSSSRRCTSRSRGTRWKASLFVASRLFKHYVVLGRGGAGGVGGILMRAWRLPKPARPPSGQPASPTHRRSACARSARHTQLRPIVNELATPCLIRREGHHRAHPATCRHAADAHAPRPRARMCACVCVPVCSVRTRCSCSSISRTSPPSPRGRCCISSPTVLIMRHRNRAPHAARQPHATTRPPARQPAAQYPHARPPARRPRPRPRPPVATTPPTAH